MTDELPDELEEVVQDMDGEELRIFADILEIESEEPVENAEQHLRGDLQIALGEAVIEYHISPVQAESVLRGLADDIAEHGFNYHQWGDA